VLNSDKKTIGFAHAMQLREIKKFFLFHGEAMLNATMLLGGEPAQRRCLALQGHISEAHGLTRHITRELAGLHALLMLERVGDPDTIETELFQFIDPDDPVVQDLCLLADRLQDLLLRIAALAGSTPFQGESVADRDAA